jgi:pyruvate/2-oxoglutarate dehydrogenase complex dihydrolipoamide acyltransferase (E2) component
VNHLRIVDVSMPGGEVTDPQRRAAVVTVGAVLLTAAAGCASNPPAPRAAGTTPSAAATQSTAATHSAEATPTAATTPSTAAIQNAAAKYMAIARPANRKLDHEFDALKDHEKDNLAAVRADLHAAAATERQFDRQLMAISFPPKTEPIVGLLYRVNEARATLTSTAAGSTSLRQLRGYAKRLDAANEPVEAAVRIIRGQLGLPPPDTS